MRILVNGATGRMGRELLALAAADAKINVAGAVCRPDHAEIGRDAYESAGLLGQQPTPLLGHCDESPACDVVIDFSGPGGFQRALDTALQRGVPLVSGTTGLDDEALQQIESAGEQIAVLWAPNMSLGMNLLYDLAERAARALGGDADVEIVEAHHRFKQDAPSGSALELGRRIATARGAELEQVASFSRQGRTGGRRDEEIGFSSVRAGDIVGEHTVIMALLGERIELVHRAGQRDVFAQGALKLARWLMGQPAGCYAVSDMLNTDS